MCPCAWVSVVQDTRVVLEGYEDEYLDDDEGGAMNDSAEQAIAQGALGAKDGPSTVREKRHVC